MDPAQRRRGTTQGGHLAWFGGGDARIPVPDWAAGRVLRDRRAHSLLPTRTPGSGTREGGTHPGVRELDRRVEGLEWCRILCLVSARKSRKEIGLRGGGGRKAPSQSRALQDRMNVDVWSGRSAIRKDACSLLFARGNQRFQKGDSRPCPSGRSDPDIVSASVSVGGPMAFV